MNENVIIMVYGTGVPSASAGVNCHVFSAASAAGSNRGCPWSTRTDDTPPSIPMTVSTITTTRSPVLSPAFGGIFNLSPLTSCGSTRVEALRHSSTCSRAKAFDRAAGGEPVFPHLRAARLAKDRIVAGEQVIAAAPDVIIGCGAASHCARRTKPVRPEKIVARPGWDAIPAVRNNHIFEVTSAYVLQPGPAALTEGVRQLHEIIARAAA